MKKEAQKKLLEGEEDSSLDLAKHFLCGYQFSVKMLRLRGYERKRAYHFDEMIDSEGMLLGNEALWRAKMYEVRSLIDGMKNGREKLLLYYHYIQGESIERAADLIGCSRRTGYRIHQKGLLVVSLLLRRQADSQ